MFPLWCDLIFVVFRFQNSDGEVKYLGDAEELIRPERNTLLVSFTDLEGFNQELATTIQEEYYRWEMLCFIIHPYSLWNTYNIIFIIYIKIIF